MKPGRELDLDVARKVFRYAVLVDNSGEATYFSLAERRMVPVPQYSTVVEDAYRVVRFLQSKGWSFVVTSPADDGSGQWMATFKPDTASPSFAVPGDTLSHAIALSAVKMVEMQNKGH